MTTFYMVPVLIANKNDAGREENLRPPIGFFPVFTTMEEAQAVIERTKATVKVVTVIRQEISK